MKYNKGITIMNLIITIIIIIILAGITMYYNLIQNIERAVETKTVYEVNDIIDAISNRALIHKLNPSFYGFIGKNDFEPIEVGNGIEKETYSSEDGWYLIDTSAEFTELGLDNITGRYLVRYDISSVISIDGVSYKEKIYYSLNDLKKEMGGGSTIMANVEYDSNKKVNKPILSKGMIPVKLQGNNWVVTSADDENWYDYSKEQMAWANVMLMDELSLEGYDNNTLKTASISELVGKKVLTEGSGYVWIPRYTTTSVGETGSKIIFSKLTNDTESLNGETYTCPSAFKYNDLDLTGIWVSKYEAGFSENN